LQGERRMRGRVSGRVRERERMRGGVKMKLGRLRGSGGDG
jgi:hypothetical protein